MTDLSSELKNISTLIDEVLLEHPYPSTIEPQWLREQVLSYPNAGGKRLRPALCIWLHQALSQEAIPKKAAAAIELFHTWTLVHDDIIDEDETRRGTPTCHTALAEYAQEAHGSEKAIAKKFGESMAILAGDLQQSWAIKLINEASQDGVRDEVCKAIEKLILEQAYVKVLAGEAMDVEFELRDPRTISSAEVLTMIEYKTAILLKTAAEAGCLTGLNTTNLHDPIVKAAGNFALAAGMAFQIQDDILGIFADFTALGKPIGSDIAKAKVTPLMSATYELAEESDCQYISSLYGKEQLSPNELERCQTIVTDCGALEKIQSLMQAYQDEAYQKLEEFASLANLCSSHLDKLRFFIDFMTKRNY